MSANGDDPSHLIGARSGPERGFAAIAWSIVLNGVLVAAFVVGVIPIVAIAHGFV